jgi:hypothetical protein
MSKSEGPKSFRTPTERVHDVVIDIAKMEHAGDCMAIAAVVIDKNGTIHRLAACGSQVDLVSLIGGTVTLQHKLIGETQPRSKGSDLN